MMNLAKSLLLAAALVVSILVTTAHAAPPYQNTTSGTFGNSTNACTGTSFKRTITVPDNIVITDIDVGILISHAWREDVRAWLTSPVGTSVLLFNDAGSGGGNGDDNYNVLIDDDLTTPGADSGGSHALTPLYANSVASANALSAFHGQNAQGNWTLNLCDSFSEDDGNFLSVELFLTGSAVTPPGVLSCGASALRHDWNNYTWTPGSLSNQYSDSGEDIRVTISGATGDFGNDPITGDASPNVSNTVTGGQGTSETSLFLFVDHPSVSSSITITIDVGDLSGGPNNGVGELQFKLFDVDYGVSQFEDRLTVTGTDGTNSVTPTLTAGLANSVSGNVAIGTGASAPESSDGNVTVTFSDRVTQVTIVYDNGPNSPSNPGVQAISLYDVLTCPAQFAVLAGAKSTRTVTGGYALPGNDIYYTIAVQNTGTGPTDTDSVFLVDTLPTEVEFYRGTLGSTPVTFTETGTGLDPYNFLNDVGFSASATKPSDFSQCSYTPTAGYDPAVRYICFNPKGEMAAGDPDPEFSYEFRVRIK